MTLLRGRHRVRWSKADEAFQMQCDACLAWLEITPEFWVPGRGLGACRTCFAESHSREQRAKNHRRRADPAIRQADAEALRVKRAANRDWWLEYRRRYYREHRDQITARRRELYAARKAA